MTTQNRIAGQKFPNIFPGHRCDSEDRAAAGFFQFRSGDLRQLEQREHIQVEGAAEIRHRHVEWFWSAAAGIADDMGELAKLRDRFRDQSGEVVLVGDI